jgi:hypothetical protein
MMAWITQVQRRTSDDKSNRTSEDVGSKRRASALLATAFLLGLVPAAISGAQSPVHVAASNNYVQTITADNPVSYWRLSRNHY